MRTFIAITVTQGIKEALSRLQDHLKRSQADVKWVDPKNIHLTLAFLGEIDEKQAGQVARLLDQLSQNHRCCRAGLNALGAFPSMGSPRVIWADIDEGKEEIKSIAQELRAGLSAIGFLPEERPFAAHLTLGRMRSGAGKRELIEALKNCQIREKLEFRVEKLTFFKSTLSPKGPLYEAIKEVMLKKD
jgi:RNA 2',3'-cyclic 3'-phosphodiesterase